MTDTEYPIQDDLSIPPWMDCRNNPDVIAARERAREMPLIPAVRLDTKTRNLDAEAQAYREAEVERERIKTQNGKDRKTTQTISGGRFDSRRNRWISAKEDFASMARQARMTVPDLHAAFEDVAAMPDMPLKQTRAPNGKTGTIDPNKECCRAFARRILKGLNNA